MSAFSDLAVLEHLAYHVFFPPKLPQEEQREPFQQTVDLAIVRSVKQAGESFGVENGTSSQWSRIGLMLQRLYNYVEVPLEKTQLGNDIRNMEPGDVLSLYIKAQNAGVIIRKQANYTTFEVFEVQAQTEEVMSTPGKIVRHFPGPAVQISNPVANDVNFISEVANILAQMNVEVFDKAHPKTRKAGTDVHESRNSINPNYFIQYFFGFLRGMGTTVDPTRVVKRLADEVLWRSAKNPWRRSPIWLIIRIALQTSLDSTATYKNFMVYYHASIVSQCYKHNSFPSDLLHAMRVKMARRLYKIKDTAFPFVISTAETAADGTQRLLQGRWDTIQSTQAQSRSPNLSGTDFGSAVNHTLPHSRSYLERVFHGRSSHINPSPFTPSHSPRLEDISEFTEYADEALTRAFANDPHLALFDFEASVFNNLSGWTSRQSDYPGACATMSSCFQQYFNAAKSYYTTDAADKSIMVLTLVRIWMAIDQLATGHCPLLTQFSPELPDDILNPLLLRSAQHIEQARIIQQHICARRARAAANNSSIFSDEATSTCFAVQFFRSSPRHQQLKQDIERHAQEERGRKIQELAELNARHDRLSGEIQRMSHHYYYSNGWERHDSWACGLCSKETERRYLSIQPYEWPLPRYQLDAEAAVFELDRPKSFAIWRNITYEILVDIGTLSQRSRCEQYTTVEGYSPLASRLSKPSTTSRITIASATKPFMQSHYNSIGIPSTESQVCRDNALQFRLYDNNQGTWAAGQFPGVTLSKFGTLKLPSGSMYRHLEYTLENTTHTSNGVLADQHDCPKELSLHEHIAFGTLRSGARLQWMNIVRGLEEDLLTLSSDEVWLLHTQATWQIGPLSNDGSRQWHADIGHLEFGHLLVTQCRRVLGRVKANWLQAKSVLTIVALVNRLIASIPPAEVINAACDFLREARIVAHQWLGELLVKLQSAIQEDDVIAYQHRVCEMAAICCTTYDIEPLHIDILLSTPNDYTALIKASICLYDNQPPDLQNAPSSLQIILHRARRFAHKIAPHMLSAVRRGEDILSTPLSNLWPDYRQGPAGWRLLEPPNNRWVTTTTTGTNGSRPQGVHLNLATGQLLIDGKPLGRLPRQYVEHPTYIRLFGQTILDVVPSKSPGMVFATRGNVHGYQISFALEDSSGQLIVQAQRQDGGIYELIPYKMLSNDFPFFFSEDYHHWADMENKTVQFRPLSAPWSAGKSKWILRFDYSRSTTLNNSTDGSLLVDIHSAPFKSLADSISPLESAQYLHITRSTGDHIEAELPRMKLSFFINNDRQLESRNFRGLVLDENQSAGTLFGLKNQLLLRARGTTSQSLPRSRSVLIPDGEISFTMHDHHVSVSIAFDSRRDVDVYRYKVDQDLGYLATDTGLTSRLFKTYLHALTSYCLPDPLTGRTGTEEALHGLSQGSSSSFEQINLKQAGLLKAIGMLTPKREHYPEHLQCMQTTHWINLPSLSQHFAFSSAATAVLHRADALELFHPLDFNLQEYIAALETSDTLLKRAARRTAMYYPSDMSGYIAQIIDPTAVLDSVCPGRDSLAGDWEEAGQAAMWASGLVHRNWGRPIFKPYDLVSLAESWGTLNDQEEHKTLSYRSSWFGISLKSCWISFYNLLRQARVSSNRYMLSACLAGVAFGQTLPTDLIPVFLAFATNSEFQALDAPPHRIFEFGDRYEPTRARLESFASINTYPMESSPAGDLSQNAGETGYELHQRRVNYYHSNLPQRRSQFLDNLMNQWPHTHPQPSIQLYSPNTDHSRWFNVGSCLESARQYFASCIWNIKLKDHLRMLEGVLVSHPASPETTFTHVGQYSVNPPVAPQRLGNPWNALDIPSLMHSRPTPGPTDIRLFSKFLVSGSTGPNANTTHLKNLFAEFQQSRSTLNRQYASDLEESRKELDSKPSVSLPGQLSPATMTDLEKTRQRCVGNLANAFQQLKSPISPQNVIERVLLVAGVWPRITPWSVLQQLSLQNRPYLDSLPSWRNELIGYAQVFADYQRSQRLVALAESNNTEEFFKELDLASSEDDPGLDDPDWLLVQIDGDFGARTVQRQVAWEMISPSSGSNTALQLNMGEGKSSVIVPIIATSLADSSRLVRVVVLKPLWRQMFDSLVNRISGLANRRIYYLPFGRHTRIDSSSAEKLRSLYEECMREGGILLTQPEHILSFKLMGIDRLISSRDSGDPAVANTLRHMQNWLNVHTRDILDESDEILHVRYQLVYTIGEQQPLDDHPDRWTTTQQLLHLTAKHVEKLQQEYPSSLLHKRRDPCRFPMLRIMPDCPAAAERKLVSAIAMDVRNGRLQNLSCDRLPLSARNILHEFFTISELPFSEYESLRHNCDPTMWKGLLLVRGLLASGILVFALKNKHYRVDYGLHPSRSLLAVPYRAKDIPSLRAEFGHPDVAVVLTCFSYYYQGLTDHQLDLCFELLFKLDNPSLEYEQWVQGNDATPDYLKRLNGINIKDRQQFTERLVPTFSHNSATIDFFLSSVVFPKEAKEFPEKLATSGWDLAEKKHHVTTGFSGTNDNRYLLPTSITQADPVKQLSTNALVLNYLLQPENNCYICMRDENGGNLTTEGFLKLLVAQTPEMRVLLDVGAQMLELQNEELVRCWLRLRPDIDGAVYFNDRDELVVLPQNSTPVLLSTSPFGQHLDNCIVYLDDGHTRGTDLKLPKKTRALVTLGPKVTKDRLLQGCMRMRKLGHGQSVMFSAPPEIDTQIRNAHPNPICPEGRVDALDVLRWAMVQTCKDLKHHVSHWAHQGIEFGRRFEAEQRHEKTHDVSVLQKGWSTPESRPLKEMYGVPSPEALRDKASFMRRAFDVPELRKGLEKLGIERLDDPSMDEEQEREVDHEVEREEELQRPPKGQPANHSLHPDVKHFVNTGTLPTHRPGIIPLFHPFQAFNPQLSNSWSNLLFASVDFLQTIVGSPTDHLSEYMRPVNWIMSGLGDIRVVLSPYEVNELLPLIRTSSAVQLHVYSPRVSIAMLSFSDLQFYSIPASPQTHINLGGLSPAQLQLDLFAGQLYLSSYQDYVSLCAMLGLFAPSGSEDDLHIEVESDGFVKPEHRDQLIQRHPEYSNCRFTSTPISALKDLVGRRRKGMRYLLTHIGQIIHARSLTQENF
ncbi:hypothetical protein FRC11_009494 [Ceratobasidium sp. 423]|nr:hypothetical protein FRC11_009494 [Ceratobasidium sp. 423]